MPYLAKVREFVSSEFAPDLAPTEIPDDLDLIESGIIDSLGVLKLIAFLEEDYELTILIEETEADRYRTLESIGAFITAKRAENPVSA